MRRAVAALWLAGCAPAGPLLPDAAPYPFSTDSNGLALSDSDLRVDFGRTRSSTVPAVSRLMSGPPESDATTRGCGAEPLETVHWAEGLTLVFRDGAFRGWVTESAVFKTGNGLSPGMTRRSLEAAGVAFRQTPPGSEFEAGGVFGLIEDDGPGAQVTAMWAGEACPLR